MLSMPHVPSMCQCFYISYMRTYTDDHPIFMMKVSKGNLGVSKSNLRVTKSNLRVSYRQLNL